MPAVEFRSYDLVDVWGQSSRPVPAENKAKARAVREAYSRRKKMPPSLVRAKPRARQRDAEPPILARLSVEERKVAKQFGMSDYEFIQQRESLAARDRADPADQATAEIEAANRAHAVKMRAREHESRRPSGAELYPLEPNEHDRLHGAK
jgi:hypothetical protein